MSIDNSVENPATYQERLPASPVISEQVQAAKVVEFEDERGVERRPHPEAPECYATEEIQTIVSEHFIEVDKKIEDIRTRLDDIEDPETPKPKPFNPLSDELLEEIREVVKEQLPTLTETRTVSVAEEITEGRLFKKKKTIHKNVEKQVPVKGFTSTTEDRSHKDSWQTIGYTADHNAEYTREEDIPVLEKTVGYRIKELLVGEERLMHEPYGKKLPLLAAKLRDSGLTTDQIDELTWEDVERLVPEATTWFGDVHRLEECFQDRVIIESLREIEREVFSASPSGTGTIARIYYSDETIGQLAQLSVRSRTLWDQIIARRHPDRPNPPSDSDFIEKQHQAIAGFFDRWPSADTVLIHGTRFIPRIIRSGSLKPAANMTDDEFTFNTSRTNVPGATAVGTIHGSRAVHWAAAGRGINYARNMKVTEEVMRQDIAQRLHVQEDHPWVDTEIAKGGLGSSKLTMRLGDVVQRTPYGGYAEVSFGSDQKGDRSSLRYGVVELTPNGLKKLEGRGEKAKGRGGNDVAYAAAPMNRTNEELFDYEYPIDEMMIGIPAADSDTIPNALREAGWSEEQIQTHTFIFDEHVGEDDEIQAAADAKPRYPGGIVVPIRQDL